MLEITEKASEMIKDFLKDRDEIQTIRIVLSQGGCSGPSLGMALDESRDDDREFDDRGIKFVIENSLYEQVKPIKVDYVSSHMGSGFNFTSNMPVQPSSCCSSCSC
ncbi:MAG: iron-sulfur cluster assembly accessory protein [Deltaproteobacteria bacterium]|nr:iron-sulfur cluster assembly accessory protein [Deltaproteobacteria bacterium]